MLWTRSQRTQLIVIASGILSYAVLALWRHPLFINTPQPENGARAVELVRRFDPNIATAAELGAIPTIGNKLAATIVSYREKYLADHPGKPAFVKLDDLSHIKGIGPAKLEALEAYLIFPDAGE